MKKRIEIVKGWVKKAEHDLRIALNALETMKEPPLDTICFHAQQCVEKYLKAYLTYYGIEFPPTHELGDLALLCSTVDRDFEQFLFEVTTLTPYAVEIRYPELVSEPTLEDTKSALAIAKKVKNFVLDRLPPELKGVF